MQAFLEAVRRGNLAAAKQALDVDPSLANAMNKNGASVILIAKDSGREALVDLLLSLRSELDLFEAAAVGDVKRVDELLLADHDQIADHGPEGYTVLGYAALYGHGALVRFLLDAGADPNIPATNYTRACPLHSALERGHKDVAGMIIRAGADVNVIMDGGVTPLHFAAEANDLDTARLLVSEGADSYAMSSAGQTPKQIAESKGFFEMATIVS